jgi:hypothetical protein
MIALRWILILLMVFHASVFAVESYYFSPDKLGSSARMVRLGGIMGMSSYADSIFENPAGLKRIQRFSSSFFTSTLMDEVEYQNLAFAIRAPLGVFGIGFMTVGVDDIARTLEKKYSDRTEYFVDYYFNYKNSVAKASYQLSLNRSFHLGFSGSYYYSSFDTVTAEGMNMDFGILMTSKRFDFSFLMKNMMSSNEIKYSDTEEGVNSSDAQTEKLSLESIYSLQYKLRHFSMYGQIKSSGSENSFHKMVALQFNPRFLRAFQCSVNYKRYPISRYEEGSFDTVEKNSFGAGLTFKLFGVNIDYAYETSDHIEFANKHYMSAGYSF